MGSIDIFKEYLNLYEDQNLSKVYLYKRISLYRKIVSVIEDLGINSILDIGCSYGLLVEEANAKGIDAWGLDLPIEKLQEFHSKLPLSKGKFIYGEVEDDSVIRQFSKKKVLGITLLDTLRNMKSVKNILKLEPHFIIIIEVSNNFYIRRKRRKEWMDLHLYSPCDYLKIFPEYSVIRIYSSKFLFHVEKPNFLCLKLMNLLPTYTIVLERKS
jgi:SAM-dependent methyltransferase